MKLKKFLLNIIFYCCLSLTVAGAIQFQIAQNVYGPAPPVNQPLELVPAPIIGNINAVVNWLEERLVTQYQNYLGLELFGTISSLEQTAQTLEELSNVTCSKPALLYVVSFKNRLELLLILPNHQPVRRVISQANRQVVEKVVRDFRAAITNSARSGNKYLSAAQQLYQWIVAPLEAELQNNQIETLIFCMDAGLRSIPLAALHNGQTFLIEEYSIALIPSFSLTDTRYRRLDNSRLLAAGISKSTQEQSSLPAVAVEVSTLTNELWQGKALLDEASTVDNFKAANRQERFSLIHIATHAEFKPGAVNNSYIQFWNEKLHLDQLRQLSLELEWEASPKVELLVLSACRTALGDEQAELGFTGLALQAGVKTALGSLWYVSDEGTLALMSEFYQQLKAACIKAEALRQAQLAMLKGDVRIEGGKLRTVRQGQELWVPLPPQLSSQGNLSLSHPYYWSGFTMIGNWN